VCAELYYSSYMLGLGFAALVVLSIAEWRCMNTLVGVDTACRSPAIVSGGILAALVGVSLVVLLVGTEARNGGRD
jgi:hypothetical protein